MGNVYFISVDIPKKEPDSCVAFESKILYEYEKETTGHQSAINPLAHHLEEDYGIGSDRVLAYAGHAGQVRVPFWLALAKLQNAGYGLKIWPKPNAN